MNKLTPFLAVLANEQPQIEKVNFDEQNEMTDKELAPYCEKYPCGKCPVKTKCRLGASIINFDPLKDFMKEVNNERK